MLQQQRSRSSPPKQSLCTLYSKGGELAKES